MLYVVFAEKKEDREKILLGIQDAHKGGERIVLNDAEISFSDLEQFLYPSLFSMSTPIVHARFFLERTEADDELIKKMIASPTIFIFEEFTLQKTTEKKMSTLGALVSTSETKKTKKNSPDVFAVTGCLTAKDKKSRWLIYRSAVEQQPIEAILGILYWKVRTLASKEKKGNRYEVLYRAMLQAQMKAWRTGAPLDVLIEKIILEQ